MANPSLDLRGGASGPSFEGSTPGFVLTVDANGKTVSPQPPTGGGGGLVSFNGRTAPAVVPTDGDYEADQIPYIGDAPGADVEAALDGLQAEVDDLQAQIDNLPAAPLLSFNGRTVQAVVPTAGDYGTDQVTNTSDVPALTDEGALNALYDLALTSIIRATLADLVASDLAILPNGCRAFVVDQQEFYTLDTANTFAASSPLVLARGVGAGRWLKRSKAYVVGAFTLWCSPFGGVNYGDGNSRIAGYTPGQRTATAAIAADIVLDVSADFPPATASLWCVIPDSFGNVWAMGYTDVDFLFAKICKYNLSDLVRSSTPAPALVLSISIPIDPQGGGTNSGGFLFDHENNLWVVTGHGGTFGACVLQRYKQTSLLSTSSPTPDVSLTLYGGLGLSPSTGNTFFAAFDSNGSMWVTVGFAGTPNLGGVFMLSREQLAVSDSAVVPSVFWFGTNFGPNAGTEGTGGIQFGPTGLLWMTSPRDSKIQAWDPRAPQSGNPAPAITLTSATFNHPIGLAFDSGGNLWAANESDNKLYRIPKASLAASGAVVPDIIISQSTLPFASVICFPGNPNLCGFQPSGVAAP